MTVHQRRQTEPSGLRDQDLRTYRDANDGVMLGHVEKLRFMSPAWIEMAREQIIKALTRTDLGGMSFTLCEEFTNPPDDLRREGATTTGFVIRIVDGRVEVEGEPTEECDLRIVSDYDDALAIARDPDAPVAQPKMMEQRIAEGRLKILGDPAHAPAVLAGLDIHRLLSSYTA